MASSGARAGPANRASSPSCGDPGPYLAPFPLRTGGFRKVRGKPAAPAPSPITTPSPRVLRPGVQAGTESAGERPTAGKLFAETPASSGAHPLPALRAIRHYTSTVHSCVMVGAGGTKRILFSKVSLRFGRGTREKRKQGLPPPGIRVLTGWRGDRSAHSATQTPNSGTLTTATGRRGVVLPPALRRSREAPRGEPASISAQDLGAPPLSRQLT